MEKEKKFYQTWWFWVFMVIVLGIFLFSFGETDYDSIENEYSQHEDTLKTDFSKIENLMVKWNTISEGNIDVDDVGRLAQIAQDYQREYSFVKNHLENYQEFIVLNEDELKNLGLNTFEEKKSIDDFNVIVQNNIDGMKDDIEEYILYFEAQQQETDKLEDILGILELLI